MVPSVQKVLSERFSGNVDSKVHHRQILVISGAEVWCLNQVEQIINQIINDAHSHKADSNKTFQPHILTCNAALPKTVHADNYGQQEWNNSSSTNNGQFRQHLGREYDLVVYNAWRGFKASALAALAGTIKKNGLFILLCPDLDRWPEYQDDELVNRISWGSLEEVTASGFIQHLVNNIKTDLDVLLLDESGFRGTNHLINPHLTSSSRHIEEQRDVIELIKKVATGRRKRPLIITAERGRGKSAAIGIAVAELLAETTSTPARKILVTAPQKASVETLFRHAVALQPDISDHLQFCAVDDLILNLPEADMLIVDEAAAIPVAQLKTLCEYYHRMVCSTTTNGYEGSGRGFEVRFKPWLHNNRPDAKFCTLSLPFRWYMNDCLEAFWWDTLHLKPEQTGALLNGSNLMDINEDQLIFKEVSKAELLKEQLLLNTVFSLLVDAHYQTTPDDLVALMDAPEQRLFVLFANLASSENIVGVLSGSIEGNIDDVKLAMNVAAGQRRVQGHMLPQQLTYGGAQAKLLHYRYFRVIRIAVRNKLRSKGFGSILLKHTQDWCSENQIQVMGSSFGASAELLAFWFNAEFSPLLLGFHRDKATAEFNITVAKQLNKDDELASHLSLVRENLAELLNCHVTNIWNLLENNILISLLLSFQTSSKQTPKISQRDKSLLNLFCNGNRSLELSCAVLQRLVLSKLPLVLSKLSLKEKVQGDYSLLTDYSIKKLSNAELIRRHNLKGKKQLLAELKKQTQCLLEA